jgi:hypothetical protein
MSSLRLNVLFRSFRSNSGMSRFFKFSFDGKFLPNFAIKTLGLDPDPRIQQSLDPDPDSVNLVPNSAG